MQPKNPKHWRELAGIRVELAIPTRPDCRRPRPPEFGARQAAGPISFTDVPTLSTADIPADVRLTVGGASAGFHPAAAMDYLEAHPTRACG